MSDLILVLPDQLSRSISSLRSSNSKDDVVFFLESKSDWSIVNHHKKKIVYLLSSMRHFAAELIKEGLKVEYLELDNHKNSGIFEVELNKAMKKNGCNRIVVTKPGDYQTLERLDAISKKQRIEISILEDDRFLCGEEEFHIFAKNKKNLRPGRQSPMKKKKKSQNFTSKIFSI